VPSTDAAVTAALAEGAALALDEAQAAGGPDLALVVGSASSQWASVASEAVRLACEERVVALIAPPERALAHPVAQAATRCRVPVLSTSRAASVTAAGSRWVLSVIDSGAMTIPPGDGGLGPSAIDPTSPGAARFAEAFRAHFGRAPAPWAAEGYDAARVVADAVRRGGLSREAFVASVSGETRVTGSTGLIRFERLGRRDSAAR
jgi:ABC-type branched-subunit amino acid transport system substrate-binding protein